MQNTIKYDPFGVDCRRPELKKVYEQLRTQHPKWTHQQALAIAKMQVTKEKSA